MRYISTIKKTISDFILIIQSLCMRIIAGRRLPGSAIDTYGRKAAFVFLYKRDYSNFIQLLCNPLSILRYFEFQFVLDTLKEQQYKNHLDVSSPRLLLLYLLHHNKISHSHLINPDKDDLLQTQHFLNVLNLQNKADTATLDITQPLPFYNHFDLITSISVIEHIPDDGDIKAIENMWKALKPGGKLIITIPCSKDYSEEFRDKNTYNLKTNKKIQEKYFFQRVYDNDRLNKIFSQIGKAPQQMIIFGEKKKGIFYKYEKELMKYNLRKAVNDPYYISRDYQIFPNINALPGFGVCEMMFKK